MYMSPYTLSIICITINICLDTNVHVPLLVYKHYCILIFQETEVSKYLPACIKSTMYKCTNTHDHIHRIVFIIEKKNQLIVITSKTRLWNYSISQYVMWVQLSTTLLVSVRNHERKYNLSILREVFSNVTFVILHF